ncbi:hypothetical protein [Xenorhabdus bovienii]|uniref:hypothetical protein n=1 Tax=Xenorhabdus bovienii TaxID=40576 RepID=UPI0004D4E17B|nr:hypothetical protein [Xenorhabdus bovienii]CDG88126.1 conserved hypothetical protein [Xenorhabdus bovienii str. feltiae France]CDG91801.1 conserved hypothetical protein [Xenorhabdus bovienii str. feltiae Florida]
MSAQQLPRGSYKINRKIHNKLFKYKPLKFHKYSKLDVGDENELNIYVYKWFIVLVAIPLLIYGSLVAGLIPAFKELRDAWRQPVWRCGMPIIPDELLKELR